MATPSLMVTRCATILQRSGVYSDTSQPFERFPPDMQRLMVAAAELNQEEEPCIAYFLGTNLWTLVTTHRLVWYENHRLQSVKWSEVSDATPDDDQLLMLNPEKKLQRDQLTVLTNKGECYKVLLEPSTFHGFWKAITCMIVTNRERQPPSTTMRPQ